MPEETPTAPSTPEPSAESLLDALIDILIRDPDYTSKWLEAISTKIENKEKPFGSIGTIITTGADLGVPKEITYRIIDAIVKEDELRYSDDRKIFLVEGIYAERAKWKENRRRRQARLSPLR